MCSTLATPDRHSQALPRAAAFDGNALWLACFARDRALICALTITWPATVHSGCTHRTCTNTNIYMNLLLPGYFLVWPTVNQYQNYQMNAIAKCARIEGYLPYRQEILRKHFLVIGGVNFSAIGRSTRGTGSFSWVRVLLCGCHKVILPTRPYENGRVRNNSCMHSLNTMNDVRIIKDKCYRRTTRLGSEMNHSKSSASSQ
ncbi:hypothetical protein BDW22DRAFT_503804 [Trametopsis cervina]|nr:hypothetical protein BDW22DRAFT_503804 [Trametopsis cervina]